MSTQSRVNLKANCLNGDIVTQDLLDSIIDSCVNLVDVTAQTISSNLIFPNLASNVVSADSAYITNIFVAGLNTNQNPFLEYHCKTTSNVSAADSLYHNIDVPTSSRNKSAFTVASGKATYTGSVTAYFKIDYQIALKDARSTMEDTVRIAVNGSAVPSSLTPFTGSTSHKNVGAQCVTKLNPNDFFQLQINVVTSSENFWEIDALNCNAFPLYWGN